MANLHLVTGYAGEEHITSNDQGSFNAALMGNGEFVLERGNQFAAQVISNNKVRIFDGDLLMQGRHIRLKENTYVDLFFENGTQNYKRSDLIVVRYEKDPATDIESASLVVVKGVPTENAYVSSEKITGDIINEHALQNDTVLYKVNFDGLSIQEPVKVFSTVPTLETMKTDVIDKIEQEAKKAIRDVANAAGEVVPLFGTESPTTETVGKVKQFFVNVENGELFVCTEAGEGYTWIKIGGGLGGVPLSDCKALALEEGSDKITLTWEDPDNVVFNGETIAEWAGTRIVRKEGSNPANVDDGTLIADSTVKDQYAVEGLQDSDVVTDTQYNYALFPYTAENVYTMSDTNRVSGSLMSYDPILANNTWAQIDKASRAGVAKDIWNIGDEKDGYVIIGFDHDNLSDGSGKAGITFLINDAKKMISEKWNNTAASTLIYVNSLANTVVNNQYYNMGDVKPYIKQTSKRVLNANFEAYEYDFMLFLLSYSEITENSDGDIYPEGNQYEGMKVNAIKNISNGYWLRTRKKNTGSYTWYIKSDGTMSYSTMNGSILKCRYGFCI